MKSIGKYLKQQSNLVQQINDAKITVLQNWQQVMERNQKAATVENHAAGLVDIVQVIKDDTDKLKYKLRLQKNYEDRLHLCGNNSNCSYYCSSNRAVIIISFYFSVLLFLHYSSNFIKI
ncbi:Hypothetical_protein [Hexamita inflata]|uniref:Hypothetical_protein n=1 Tax=Hexamita inflata TaxID=28002 RepID=A0AA86REY1_9EUKA|nr:Hypothetical protein HINF_LOCUS59663 [Hexamita inflata]